MSDRWKFQLLYFGDELLANVVLNPGTNKTLFNKFDSLSLSLCGHFKFQFDESNFIYPFERGTKIKNPINKLTYILFSIYSVTILLYHKKISLSNSYTIKMKTFIPPNLCNKN